jgi:hypothetical protein
MKIRTYRTIIRPIILYGSETWTITGKIASTLMTWKRKILRKIHGPKSKQGLGHVIRMEDNHLSKMVFNAKPESRRGVGRPRLRWLDDVEADIKALDVKRWRIKA